MWDNPAALNRLSILIVLLTMLFAGWAAARLAAEQWLPIREVEVRGAIHAETRAGIPPVVHNLAGGLFSADLEAAREGFEALPWVRTATIRRMWPAALVVELEEHLPAASWNGLATLNVRGEVFPVKPWPGLPEFQAPEGMEKEVAIRYGQFAEQLGRHGWRIASIRVDNRSAWRIVLTDGVTVDLGRDRLDDRLKRFVTFYPMVTARVAGIRRVDMRYPNGFAVQGEART